MTKQSGSYKERAPRLRAETLTCQMHGWGTSACRHALQARNDNLLNWFVLNGSKHKVVISARVWSQLLTKSC